MSVLISGPYVKIPDEDPRSISNEQNIVICQEWNNFIKFSDEGLFSKIKTTVAAFFGAKPTWISVQENISIKRDFIETLESLDLSDVAEDLFLKNSPIKNLFNQIYLKVSGSSNLDKVEQAISFLRENYELVDFRIVKSKHISKALGKKSKSLLALISLINPDHYSKYLDGRVRSLNDKKFICNDLEAVNLLQDTIKNS